MGPFIAWLNTTFNYNSIQKAVNQLNAQVRETFQNNKIADESTGPYQGYSGDLGKDVIVTGQAPDTPDSGTIRLASDSDTYEITWTPGAKEDTKSNGRFKLGESLWGELTLSIEKFHGICVVQSAIIF